MNAKLREIPPVDRLLERWADAFDATPRALLVRVLREAAEDLRRDIREGLPHPDDVAAYFQSEDFAADLKRRLGRLQRPRHRRVINASGVLLHTGLGRAPLPDAALEATREIGRYGMVEVDPETGLRGRRELFVRDLLCELTGAEEATVVNNNAAAVMLLLRGLARGREVQVSRGELVEIGGGFRVPAVMEESGARLREVGTTNRTRIADYENARNEDTALVLWVHTSNFRIVGFTEAPTFDELVQFGVTHGLPVAADMGSGYLRAYPGLPFHDEPTVQSAIDSGMDMVTFSGDKMLGGPQCGILVGKKDAILRLRRQPLFRALRPDKLTLAALEATLLLWRASGDQPPAEVPFFGALAQDLESLRARAVAVQDAVGDAGPKLHVADSLAQVGSGSVPGREFASIALAMNADGGVADELADHARRHDPPIFPRVHEGRVLLDLRTVAPDEDENLVSWLRSLPDSLRDRVGD